MSIKEEKMLFTEDAVKKILYHYADNFLKEIIKNNSKCQNCACYHKELNCCFLAFECVKNNFKDFVKER